MGSLSIWTGGSIALGYSSYYVVNETWYYDLSGGITDCHISNQNTTTIHSQFFAYPTTSGYYLENFMYSNPGIGDNIFQNCNVRMSQSAGLIDAYLNNCTIGSGSNSYYLMFEHCDFSSVNFLQPIRLTKESRFSNTNNFKDLTLFYDCNLTTISTSGATFYIDGNLELTNNAIINTPDFMNIYLTGNCSVAATAQITLTTLHLTGNRSSEDPQLLNIQALFLGSILNVNSSLKLENNLTFSTPAPAVFESGILDLNSFTLKNADIQYGTITPGSGKLWQCHLRSFLVVNDPNGITLEDCKLLNSSVEFDCYALTVGTFTAGNESIVIANFNKGLKLFNSSILQDPGTILKLRVKDVMELDNSTISATETTIYSGSTGELFWDETSIFNGGSLINECPVLSLLPRFTNPGEYPDLNMTNGTIQGSQTYTFETVSTFKIVSADLQNFYVANNINFSSPVLTLDDVTITNSHFELPVKIVGSGMVIADNLSSFEDDLFVESTVQGSNAANIYTTINGDLSISDGMLVPGSGGAMNVTLGGDHLTIQGVNSPLSTRLQGSVYSLSSNLHLSANVPLECNLMTYPGSTTVITESITFLNKVINLWDANLELNNSTLTGATIIYGTTSYGILNNCSLQSATLIDINIAGTTTILDDNCVANTDLTNYGTLTCIANITRLFTALQSITNSGTIVGGTNALMQIATYGNVFNLDSSIDSWVGTIFLRGTQVRSIDLNNSMPAVIADANANFMLSGDNILPNLTIAEGSTVTLHPFVMPGFFPGHLFFSVKDAYYVGNLVLTSQNSVTNIRTPSYDWQNFYHLRLMYESQLPGVNEISMTYVNVPHANLPGTNGEYWSMDYQNDSSPVNPVCEFQVANMENMMEYDLFSFNSANSIWEKYTGPMSYGMWNNTITVNSLPLYRTYSFSNSLSRWSYGNYTPGDDSTSLRPLFTWPAIHEGYAYRIEIATDMAFSNIVYFTSASPDTSHLAAVAFNPNTTYFWRVCTTSHTFGNAVSDIKQFTTRSAITSNLPETAEMQLNGYAAYYVPAYVQGLNPDETLYVNTFSTSHLSCLYDNGTLTITPLSDWDGVETVTIEIYDGYTVITKTISVTVLGEIQYLIISLDPEGILLSWNAVGSATYYTIYASDQPDGTFNPISYSTDWFTTVPVNENCKFYRVTANTGTIPIYKSNSR